MSKSTLPALKMNAVSEEQEEPTADLDVPEEVQFAGRYKYPAVKKSVFKNIGCYKYQPRPVTPKNYNPRPKSSNRYVFVGDNDELEMETEETEETEETDDNPEVELGNEEKTEVEGVEEESVQLTEQEGAEGKNNFRY